MTTGMIVFGVAVVYRLWVSALIGLVRLGVAIWESVRRREAARLGKGSEKWTKSST